MKQFDFIVQSPVGIHARPAMLLAQKAKCYQEQINVKKGEKVVNAKNIVSLLMLNAHQGDLVTFEIEGEDEESAALELEQFCKVNL